MKFKPLLGVLCTAALLTIPTASVFASDSNSQDMYRLYNPNSGEHFYTANSTEKDNLVTAGWSYEGIGWTAPTENSNITDTQPVYRLYNPNAGDHFYTTNYNECSNLINSGWNYEGIGWYSAKDQEVPILRQYNPNCLGAGSHNFTTSSTENDSLVNAGWKAEGNAWYGISNQANIQNPATVTDQGWSLVTSYGTGYLSVGAKLQNPNPVANIEDAVVAITSYRADGTIIDSKTADVNIPANTTVPFGYSFIAASTEQPDHVTVAITSNSFTGSSKNMIHSSDFTLSNVSDVSEFANEHKVTGTVTNNSSADASYPNLTTIFYSNGKIVGGDNKTLPSVASNASSNFDVTFYTTPNYDSRDLAVTYFY